MKDTQWFSLSKVFMIFPSHKRTFLQRISTLKFPPLRSNFLSHKLSQKTELKHLNSTQGQTKSRHARKNRATIQTYDPRYDNLIQKSCHARTESHHDFASVETIHSAKKIAARHSKSRHDFRVSQNHNFESNFNISPPWLQIGDDVNLAINHHAALSNGDLLFNKLEQVQAMLEPWSR